jgi:hypothetical protein
VVTGTVTDADDGTLIAGATVTLVNGEDHAAITEGDGTYTIDDVTAGTYTATALAEEYVQDSREIEVQAGETLTVDFALTEIPEQFDTEITVQLNWQNEYREAEEAFGGVDDYAAFHLDDDGAGEVTLKWNEDEGVLVTEGETTLTSRAAGFHLHAGALDGEGEVAIALPAPSFVGDAADEPGTDEVDRGVFTYSLDGAVLADATSLATLDAALGGWPRRLVRERPHRPQPGRRGSRSARCIRRRSLRHRPLFKYFEFHELGTGTNTGEPQTSFNLWFDADIAFAGDTGQTRPGPNDFVLTINGEPHPILRVRGDNPDWQPYPKQDIRIHLDTHDVIEDGDVVEITLLDSGAAEAAALSAATPTPTTCRTRGGPVAPSSSASLR